MKRGEGQIETPPPPLPPEKGKPPSKSPSLLGKFLSFLFFVIYQCLLNIFLIPSKKAKAQIKTHPLIN